MQIDGVEIPAVMLEADSPESVLRSYVGLVRGLAQMERDRAVLRSQHPEGTVERTEMEYWYGAALDIGRLLRDKYEAASAAVLSGDPDEMDRVAVSLITLRTFLIKILEREGK